MKQVTKDTIKVYLLNFLSFIILEMFYKATVGFPSDFRMYSSIILFCAFLATIISFIYIVIFRFHKTFVFLFYVLVIGIYYLYIISYEKYGIVVNYYNFFNYYYLEKTIMFKVTYLWLLLPLIIVFLLPNKNRDSIFDYLKPTININLLLTITTLGFLLVNAQDFDNQAYNITKSSYNNGLAYTAATDLYSKRTDLRLVKTYLDNDKIPRSGFKSNSYEKESLIQIDIQGLDAIFINDNIMPNLNSLLTSATYFNNFYAINTPKTESAYFMMDTGLYLDNSSNLNTYTNLDKVYHRDLVTGFSDAGYQTNFYTNESQSLYTYAKEVGFENAGIFEASSYTLLNKVISEMNANLSYTRVVLSDKDILNTAISDKFQDMDTSEELKSYYSYMNQLDFAIKLLVEKLIENGQFMKTVIMINNTKVSDDLYYDIINIDETRKGLDYYKTPLIFIDHQKSISANNYSSFVDIFTGIADAFNLRSLDSKDSINFSCFFNPDNTVMFLDGSIVSTYYYYVSKNNTYIPKEYSYYKGSDNYEKAMLAIKNIEKRYKISQIALTGKYYHYLYI